MNSNKKVNITNLYPRSAHFLLIDKCNVKCIMCGGDYFRSCSGKRITFEKYSAMAKNLRLENFSDVTLAGAGDPLLNSEIIPIIQFLNRKYPNIQIGITTNGVAMSEEFSRQLLTCNVKYINVSINAASKQIYKRMMQVDAFEKVCRNVRHLVELRNEMKKNVPAVQLSMPINLINIKELPQLIVLAKELGAKCVNSFYTRFYPEKIRSLNIDCEDNKLKDEHCLFFHKDLSDRVVTQAAAIAKKLGIYFYHEPMFNNSGTVAKCSWPWTSIMVGFDGEIYPCGGGELHFKDKVATGEYHFGNALKEKIEEFWNNRTYQMLRLSALDPSENLIPECSFCANKFNPNKLTDHIMNWVGFESHETKHFGDNRSHSKPLVSVIVPTYNRAEMLIETLKSIQNQTYRPIEIVVVNDAGKDVGPLIQVLDSDVNIRYIHHSTNRGLSASRNTGIKSAKGKYIAYLDDDDVFYQNHIETLVNFLERSEYKVAYTDAHRAHQKKQDGKYVVTRRDLPLSCDFDYDRILYENFVPVLCFVHEKRCLDVAGWFDEKLQRHEDWDLWIRFSRHFKMAHLNMVTSEFRSRNDGSSMTSGNKKYFRTTCERIFQKYYEFAKEKPRILMAQAQMRSILRGAEALQLLQEGKVSQAIGLMKECLNFDRGNPGIYNNLDMFRSRLEQSEMALNYYEKTAQLCTADKSYQKSQKVMRTRFEMEHPPHLQDDARMKKIDTFLSQGKELMTRGSLIAASDIFQEVIEIDPFHLDAINALGEIATQAGLYDSAMFFFQRALEIDPAYTRSLNNMSAIFRHSGSMVTAEKILIQKS